MEPTTIAFWDRYASRQFAWLQAGTYHQQLFRLLSARIRPGWRLLDLGAGTGALALPLCRHGCQVTALEPSAGMRHYLLAAAGSPPPANLQVDRRTWEEVPKAEVQDYQLIIACNSLHLLPGGAAKALDSLFATGVPHLCLISEAAFLTFDPPRRRRRYRLRWYCRLRVASARPYYHPTRSSACWPVAEPEGWQQEQTEILLYWWTRKSRRADRGEPGYPRSCPPASPGASQRRFSLLR